jgi:hypothetical protein
MQEIQKWLLRARGANEKIDALNELIERMRSRSEGGGGASGGGGGSRKPGGLEKFTASIESYEARRAEIERIRDEVYDAICMLSDQRYQTALIRYYIVSQDWVDVAKAMNKDRRTIERWHGYSLNELKKIISECPTMSHDGTLMSHEI